MTFYVCFATGMADCTPSDQSYHSFETVDGLLYGVRETCEQWERDLPEPSDTIGDEFYCHAFRVPADGEDNWSQRLRIHASTDWVLDVIGMTADEFERESAE